jgi:trk system potassium uptake protein TrkH
MLYVATIITSITTITLSNLSLYGSIFDNLTDSSFQVASLISSTGFCTCDFDAWGNLSKTVLVFCMFVGACAGSTGGGLKISRVLIMLKSARKNIKTYVQPKLVQKIKIDDKTISDEMVNSVNAYFAIFTIIFVGSLLLISFEGLDFTTNFTAVLATINNIGPGLSKVGPACNFSVYGPFAKCVLIFDMLAGRLELFPLLVLLQPNNLMELFRVNRKK